MTQLKAVVIKDLTLNVLNKWQKKPKKKNISLVKINYLGFALLPNIKS